MTKCNSWKESKVCKQLNWGKNLSTDEALLLPRNMKYMGTAEHGNFLNIWLCIPKAAIIKNLYYTQKVRWENIKAIKLNTQAWGMPKLKRPLHYKGILWQQ